MAPSTGAMQSCASARPRPASASFSRRAPRSGLRVSHASPAAVIEVAPRPASLVAGWGHARGRDTGGGAAEAAASPPCLCHRCGEQAGRRVVAHPPVVHPGEGMCRFAAPPQQKKHGRSNNDPWHVRGPLCRRRCAPPPVRLTRADWHRRVRFQVATPSGTGRSRPGGHRATETVTHGVSPA